MKYMFAMDVQHLLTKYEVNKLQTWTASPIFQIKEQNVANYPASQVTPSYGIDISWVNAYVVDDHLHSPVYSWHLDVFYPYKNFIGLSKGWVKRIIFVFISDDSDNKTYCQSIQFTTFYCTLKGSVLRSTIFIMVSCYCHEIHRWDTNMY